MEINVYGTKSKRLINELSEAAEFFACCLMDRRLVRNLELDIEVENKLEVQGTTINEDGTKRSRFFTVQLKKQHVSDMIQTLAHEIVHVKQHAKNELMKDYATARGGYKLDNVWMGKSWRPKRGETVCFDAPWEVEAYGREVGLYRRWIEYKNGS